MAISPLLAIVDGRLDDDHAARLLGDRARQVYTLLKENLQLRLGEKREEPDTRR
jgi:hypothetical protein